MTSQEQWNSTKIYEHDTFKGIVVDDDQNLYFTNDEGFWRFSNNKHISHILYTTSSGIALHERKIYICQGSRILLFDLATNITEVFFGIPRDQQDSEEVDGANPHIVAPDDYTHQLNRIVVNTSSEMYFTTKCSLHKINLLDKSVQLVAGDPKKPGYQDGSLSDAKFERITGMTSTPDGILYISDNKRLRKVKDGVVSTFITQHPDEEMKDGSLS